MTPPVQADCYAATRTEEAGDAWRDCTLLVHSVHDKTTISCKNHKIEKRRKPEHKTSMQHEKDHDSRPHHLTQMLIKLNSGENAAGARPAPRIHQTARWRRPAHQQPRRPLQSDSPHRPLLDSADAHHQPGRMARHWQESWPNSSKRIPRNPLAMKSDRDLDAALQKLCIYQTFHFCYRKTPRCNHRKSCFKI